MKKERVLICLRKQGQRSGLAEAVYRLRLLPLSGVPDGQNAAALHIHDGTPVRSAKCIANGYVHGLLYSIRLQPYPQAKLRRGGADPPETYRRRKERAARRLDVQPSLRVRLYYVFASAFAAAAILACPTRSSARCMTVHHRRCSKHCDRRDGHKPPPSCKIFCVVGLWNRIH